MSSIPTFVAAGATATSVTTSLTINLPAGVVNDDVLILMIATANRDVTNPSGWTLINSFQGTGTVGNTAAAGLKCWYRVADGTQANVTVTNTTGSPILGVMHCYRGCNTSSPLDGTATGGVVATASRNVSVVGVTTAATNALVIYAIGNSVDTNAPHITGTVANATVSSLTKRSDVSFSSGASRVGVVAWTGGKATAGATGTLAGTNAFDTATTQGFVCFALKAATTFRVAAATASFVESAQNVGLNYTPPPGATGLDPNPYLIGNDGSVIGSDYVEDDVYIGAPSATRLVVLIGLSSVLGVGSFSSMSLGGVTLGVLGSTLVDTGDENPTLVNIYGGYITDTDVAGDTAQFVAHDTTDTSNFYIFSLVGVNDETVDIQSFSAGFPADFSVITDDILVGFLYFGATISGLDILRNDTFLLAVGSVETANNPSKEVSTSDGFVVIVAQFTKQTGGGGGVTLDIEVADYSESAKAVALHYGRDTIAAKATYLETAQDIAFSRSYLLSAGAASFVIAAQNVGLYYGHKVLAAAASFTLSAQDVLLSATRKGVAGAASFVLDAQDVGLHFGRRILAAAASYIFVGRNVTLASQNVATGINFDVISQDVKFKLTHRLALASANFVLTAKDVLLEHKRFLAISSASYVEAAQNVALHYGRRVGVGVGSFVASAKDVLLKHGYSSLVASAASFAVSAQNVVLSRTRSLLAAAAGYSAASTGVTLNLAKIAGAAEFLLTPQDVNLTNKPVFDPAFYVFTPQEIELITKSISANRAVYSYSAKAVAAQYVSAIEFASFSFEAFDVALHKQSGLFWQGQNPPVNAWTQDIGDNNYWTENPNISFNWSDDDPIRGN